MAYDYRPGTANKKSSGTARQMLIGLMLGLVIGIAIAAGVAIYIARIPSPFTTGPSGDAPKAHAPETRSSETPPPPAVKAETKTSEKKPYTFYDILEGNKTPKPDQPNVDLKREATTATADDKTVFYLQAGAYQTEADADNQKAKIALLGLEARVKTATVADKGTVYRVRLGPYKSQDEATQVKSTLKENGVEAGLIKIVKSTPNTGIN
jgi:cell division protein FtsN